MRTRLFCWLSVLLVAFPAMAHARTEPLSWFEENSKIISMLQYPALTSRVYQDADLQLIWTDEQLRDQFEQQLEVIQRAGFSPLFSHQLDYLRLYRERHSWFEYDLLATDTALLYLSYAQQAPIQGEKWFFSSRLTSKLPEPQAASVAEFEQAIAHHNTSAYLRSFAPSLITDPALYSAYQSLKQFETKPQPVYYQSGVIRKGDKLADRPALIARLNMVGVDVSGVANDVDWYDESLVSAVKAFQRIHGLTDDGAIGPATLKWLSVSSSKRLAMLALNTERARMWPTERDQLIVVNVPGFSMHYWAEGNEAFSSKVIVGRKARQTPVMKTYMNALIFNPTWNVPPTIMKEDILPKAKVNQSYLSQRHIQILKSWGSSEVIDYQQIDWSSVDPNNFPYRLRQASGNWNALGRYKFNTPNAEAIYLHDTPSKYLFNRASRAFSSGCIRVEHADKFASALMRTQGLNTKPEYRKSSNKALPLRSRIPVYIIYKTAWYDGHHVQYRDDVYDFDHFATSRS
ncbi:MULTISPECIES: L,D-transpeptidase family protein [unclassified Vibrio]|uniref:L,D-transpeptidase family protein n=1 Tax=unclassified Vibrio TaxID=2614977 RepID=UPI001360EF99|nr:MULTISPECIES: L,D-transpeptidase family protein [unclassified Vibrio]NAW59844.1 L,D-transpeptidase family protein [Vibrio sp. V36_P2S2PM302]NAX27649.1 L,D-transpeptidase family protein [Vibrio sp. V38_P2S17PM301]NAX30056.1 L,D-transpeptidase family protein [Vibrio sp. V37_P2S8PM304]